MRRTAIILMVLLAMTAQAIDLTKATIVYHKNDHPLVAHMAGLMADDIERVSGVRPRSLPNPNSQSDCMFRGRPDR